MPSLDTVDPRTAERRDTGITPTSTTEVQRITALAASAAQVLENNSRSWRSGMLRAMGDAIDRHRSDLVATAMTETGLAHARLDAEVTRSADQFRMFADAVDDGGYLELAIDHAVEGAAGRLPELRRMLVPIGPIAVFGSSNFPFAFSVLGGDTSSALAAGNPVVVKAHSSHLLVSRLSFELLQSAATEAGAPAGTIQIVYGQRAGSDLVGDPEVRAVGFTGSQSTARVLLDIIGERPEPIPFYGELSSLNPLVVSPGAAAGHPDLLAQGLLQSFTGSGGQLCTKPGIAFIPRTATTLVDAILAGMEGQPPAVLLNERISTSFEEVRRSVEHAGAEVLGRGGSPQAGFAVSPAVLGIDAGSVTRAVVEEAFGPLIVLAFYDDLADLLVGLGQVPNSLTATLHSEPHEIDFRGEIVAAVQTHVGRIVFNGYPTGVRVSWAQHHGGPWPATNTLHTSVGVTALRRFLRPLAWQDAPRDVLPAELQDDTRLPRRVDGVLTLGRS